MESKPTMKKTKSTPRATPGRRAVSTGSALPLRTKWHDLLSRAMDETREGDFFLPQFVRLVMLDLKPNTKTTDAEP